jgi:hypothetical protein
MSFGVGKRLAALVLLAFSMIGAKGCDMCDIPWPSYNAPSTSPPETTTPALPWCYTDPPLGCQAVCLGVGDAMLMYCDDPGAGPLEMQFQMDIDGVNDLPGGGCNQGGVGLAITPCTDGIMPVELPNQDHSVCTPPPPGCSSTGC